MTQYERMTAGLLYDPADKEVLAEQSKYQEKLWEFNRLRPHDYELKEKYLKEMFAEIGEGCWIQPPIYANWGCHNVHFGKNVFANHNLDLVDDGHIYVGDCVLFGPNVTVATANHPMEPSLREKGLQYNKDVHIGKNVWIGAGVVIVPGVTVGENTVIGAGSIVTKDLPAGVFAAGNPCRVIREIGETDREYFYKKERIDWENL